ncbi:MAG: hypothetical protein K8963_06570 [Proteobacteria bacterium]|nr:hypothetical protein [Pseudomonadota bacterium]
MKHAKNKRLEQLIDLSKAKPLSQPGLYVAVMTPRGKVGAEHQSVTHFFISDIALHARQYEHSVDVYVSSIKYSAPVEGADIIVRDFDDDKIIGTARTDVDGRATVDVIADQHDVYISAAHGNSRVYLTDSQYLHRRDTSLPQQRSEELFIHSPRDLYRPGEVVEFGLLRRGSDGRRLDPSMLTGILRSPDNSIAEKFVLQADDIGYYRHRLQLSVGARTGQWSIIVRGGAGGFAEYRFHVQDFLPQRLDLSFTDTVAQGKIMDSTGDVIVPVRGRYLHGSPASGNRVSATVSARAAKQPIEKLEGYSFGDAASHEAPRSRILDNITLDEEGKGELVVPANWLENQMPLDVNLTATIYEKSGRVLTRGYSFVSWSGRAMIGIRPRCLCRRMPDNSTVEFDVVKVLRDGTLVAAQGVSVRLILVEYHHGLFAHPSDEYMYPIKINQVVSEQAVNLNSVSPTLVQVHVKQGIYRLEITDTIDNNLIGSLRFYTGLEPYHRPQPDRRGATSADKVDLILDKLSYRQGDSVRVRIEPPYSGQAIVLVESNRRLWHRRLHIPSEGAVVEIPIDPHWRRQDLYVSATVFGTGGRAGNISTPLRATGLVHLPLDREDSRLNVELTVPTKLESNKPQEIVVTVGNAGQTVQEPVYVTVAVADIGVLKLTDFKSPDPFEFFFKPRDYSVEAFDSYGREDKSLEFKKSRASGNQSMYSSGLHTAALASSVATERIARADVQILSILTEPVKVGADGRARVTLNIPPYNGRVRLMAMAYGHDRIGSSELEVSVTAPVVIQASLPRFMAFGDTARAQAVIFNTTKQTQTYDVNVQVQGAVRLTQEAGMRTVELTRGDLALVALPLKAVQQTGRGSISIAVTRQGMQTVTERRTIDVRPAWPAVGTSIGGDLLVGDRLNIDESLRLNEMEDSTVEFVVTVSNRPNLRPDEHLLALLRYPYGCLEQTTSAAFALVYLEPDRLKETARMDGAAIKSKMNKVLRRLSALRRESGGFGLWGSLSPEEHWLTVHTAELLLRAQARGYAVQPDLLEHAIGRLQHYLGQPISRPRGIGFRSSARKIYDFSVRSYAAYVLSTINKAELSELHKLHQKYFSTAQPSQPIAAISKGTDATLPTVLLALALRNQGDAVLAQQLLDSALAQPASSHSRGNRHDYGSGLRDEAMIVHLLLENNLHTEQALERAQVMTNTLNGLNHISTQERRALLAAAISLDALEKTPWQVAINTRGNKKYLSGQGSRSYIFSRDQIGDPASLLAVKGKHIYASISVTGYPHTAPDPVSSDIKISRSFFTPQDNPADLNQIKNADTLGVEIIIESENYIKDALVVDLLPAGFEFDNSIAKRQGLATREFLQPSGRGGDYPYDQRPILKHQEFRDDRMIASLSLQKGQTYTLTYYVRAVTPGTYSLPASLVEDMYNPERRAFGKSAGRIVIGSYAE